MHSCTVCNDWYPATGTGITDICVPCLELNFAGAQPPLDIHAPMAREALEAYVFRPPDHAQPGAGPGPHARGLAAAAGRGGRGMTFDVGLLVYADAVPLARVDSRYCLGCAEVFVQRRRDQAYCCRTCQVRITMRGLRRGTARTGKRGRPRVGRAGHDPAGPH